MIKKRTWGMWAALVSGALLIGGCSSQQNTEGTMDSSTEERTRNEVNENTAVDAEERRAALDELEDLRRRMNKSMNDVDAQMRRTEDQAELDQLREYRFELEQNRARVEDEIRNLEVSDRSTWDEVRTKAGSTAKDVGEWFDRQGEKFKDLIDAEGDTEGMDNE